MLRTIDEVIDKYPTIKFTGYSTWDEENPIKLPLNHAVINLKGQKFNHLTVLELFPFKSKDNRPLWIVECDCDAHTIFVTTGKSIRTGNTRSCGCAQVASVTARNLKHGLAYRNNKSRLYGIHCDMIRRCYNPNRKSYKTYGARGITVCDEWRGEDGFINFYNWAYANGYYDQPKGTPKAEMLSIERKNNDLGYSPDNCAWIPFGFQVNNRTVSIRFNIAGIMVPIGILAAHVGIDRGVLDNKHSLSKWRDDLIVHFAFMHNKAVRKGFKSDIDLVDEEGFRCMIPNYANLNPWSDNIVERKFAMIYLTEDDLEWLLRVKRDSNQ